jgi:hypothetical protein
MQARRNRSNGDGKATGILHNPMYDGQVVWNRLRWVRSAANSHKRRRVANPQSEWIAHQEERLRIVPPELWKRVRARKLERSQDVGFDARVLDTLHQIAPPDRRLLALRAYLRAGDSLAARWSWSQQQLSDYPTTVGLGL